MRRVLPGLAPGRATESLLRVPVASLPSPVQQSLARVLRPLDQTLLRLPEPAPPAEEAPGPPAAPTTGAPTPPAPKREAQRTRATPREEAGRAPSRGAPLRAPPRLEPRAGARPIAEDATPLRPEAPTLLEEARPGARRTTTLSPQALRGLVRGLRGRVPLRVDSLVTPGAGRPISLARLAETSWLRAPTPEPEEAPPDPTRPASPGAPTAPRGTAAPRAGAARAQGPIRAQGPVRAPSLRPRGLQAVRSAPTPLFSPTLLPPVRATPDVGEEEEDLPTPSATGQPSSQGRAPTAAPTSASAPRKRRFTPGSPVQGQLLRGPTQGAGAPGAPTGPSGQSGGGQRPAPVANQSFVHVRPPASAKEERPGPEEAGPKGPRATSGSGPSNKSSGRSGEGKPPPKPPKGVTPSSRKDDASGATFSWRAPSAPSPEPERASSSATPRPPPGPQPTSSREPPTERELLQVLSALAVRSPEARALLREVRQQLDELRHIDNLRRI